jgi:hypothetical protein
VQHSFLDFEFSFIALDDISFSDYVKGKYSSIDESVISTFICCKGALSEEFNTAYFDNSYVIDEMDFNGKDIALKQEDINRAKLVNTVYNMGAKLMYIRDMYEVKQYKIIIDILCRYTSKSKINDFWNKASDKDKFSSLCCADCFDVKLNSLSKYGIKDVSISDLIKDNIVALAVSEHARWNMEQLLLSQMPISKEELRVWIAAGECRRSIKDLYKAERKHPNISSLAMIHSLDKIFFYDFILFINKYIKKIVSLSPRHTSAVTIGKVFKYNVSTYNAIGICLDLICNGICCACCFAHIIGIQYFFRICLVIVIL